MNLQAGRLLLQQELDLMGQLLSSLYAIGGKNAAQDY